MSVRIVIEHFSFSLHLKMCLFLNTQPEKKNRHWQAANVLNMESNIPAPQPSPLSCRNRRGTWMQNKAQKVPRWRHATSWPIPPTSPRKQHKDNLLLKWEFSLGQGLLWDYSRQFIPIQTNRAIFRGYSTFVKLILFKIETHFSCAVNSPSEPSGPLPLCPTFECASLRGRPQRGGAGVGKQALLFRHTHSELTQKASNFSSVFPITT